MEIKDYLKVFREKEGLTQEVLAEKIGVTRQAISKWECGDSIPDIENIIILSDLYGVSVDELLRGAKFLPKPFTIGEYKFNQKMMGGMLLSLFFAGVMSGGSHLWVFIGIFVFLLGLTLAISREGKIILKRNSFEVIWYKGFFEKFLSVVKKPRCNLNLSYDSLVSLKIEYGVHRSLSPIDFNPDHFNIRFKLKDDSEFVFEVGNHVSENLPIICDFLSKKGVDIEDSKNVIHAIVSGENLYDAMR